VAGQPLQQLICKLHIYVAVLSLACCLQWSLLCCSSVSPAGPLCSLQMLLSSVCHVSQPAAATSLANQRHPRWWLCACCCDACCSSQLQARLHSFLPSPCTAVSTAATAALGEQQIAWLNTQSDTHILPGPISGWSNFDTKTYYGELHGIFVCHALLWWLSLDGPPAANIHCQRGMKHHTHTAHIRKRKSERGL
jgi:hypothetical protein